MNTQMQQEEWSFTFGGLYRSVRTKLRRRHLVFPVIMVVHLAVLIILLVGLAPPAVSPKAGAPLSLFDVSGPPEELAQPDPVVAEIIVPEPVVKLETESDTPVSEPVFDQAAARQAGFGTTCDIAATLGHAFADNQALRSALARWGPAARSVSNAIMLWDGKWVSPEPAIEPEALALVRRGVIEGIRAGPPECRIQELTGPMIILVQEDLAPTTVLVLGSGKWTWEQVVLHDLEVQHQASVARRIPEAFVPVRDTTSNEDD